MAYPLAYVLVILEIGDSCGSFEEVEVAAFVLLLHVVRKQLAVAPQIPLGGQLPGGAAPLQLLVAELHI